MSNPLTIVNGGRRRVPPPRRPAFLPTRRLSGPPPKVQWNTSRRFRVWRTEPNGVCTLLFAYENQQAADDLAAFLNRRLPHNTYAVEDAGAASPQREQVNA